MIKKVLTASLWIVSLWVCLLFSFLTYDSSIKDIIISVISFVLMVALIIFKISDCLQKNEIKFEILHPFFILSLFFLLLFRNHVNFGYGNTLGILGYDRQIGILSMFGMSRTVGFIGLCISYAALCTIVLCRYSAIEKISNKLKKLIIIAATILSIIIEILGINVYATKDRLSGVFFLSVIVYIVLYIFLNIISKKLKATDRNG